MRDNNYLQSRIRSIRIALDGIKHVLISQQNARIHAVISLVVLILAILLRLTSLEWTALLVVIGLVWTAEIFNTAMEVLVDMVSPEHSQGGKVIKDISAGAVLITALLSILVGILIFGPKLVSVVEDLFK